MKQTFSTWKPSANSVELLGHIQDVLDVYAQQGYLLTLRQLYYQMVSRDLFPDDRRWSLAGSRWIRDPQGTKNAEPNYKWLGEILSNGRLAGYVDWDMIEDRSRVLKKTATWDNPREIIEAAANSYHVDPWEDADNHVEVWAEKDAVSNILEPVCRELEVAFIANRGYSSQSAMYTAYKRFQLAIGRGKTCRIIYFGDHDPSGIDMSRDIQARLSFFLYGDVDGFDGVERVALNMDQIERFNPPKDPAKVTDSRYRAYVERFGESSWELDALEPKVLSELARHAVIQYVDRPAWRRAGIKEQAGKDEIMKIAESMEDADE